MAPAVVMGARHGSGDEDGMSPRIWVGCLAAYNNGHLHGTWIDAAQEPEQIRAEISEMLAASPIADAEEWAIMDHEGWAGIDIGEYESPEVISQLAELLAEHGPLFGRVVDHCGGPRYLDEAIETMTERYQGTYRSLADWAESYAEDSGIECGEPWKNYIDFERWANDAEMGGDVFSIDLPDGTVAIFTNH